MTDGVIPASPYPVLKDHRKPSREIWGPYIASKPAYQIFADMAKTGGHIGDYIAADVRAQAKAEGRADPVREYPENQKFWINDGNPEPLPQWPNGNTPWPPSAPPADPVDAPAAPKTTPPTPTLPDRPIAPPSIAPRPPLPRPGPSPHVPAQPWHAAPSAPAAQPSPGTDTTPGTAAAITGPSGETPVAGVSARRGRSDGRASAIHRRLAAASYARPTRDERLAQRAAARSAGPAAI